MQTISHSIKEERLREILKNKGIGPDGSKSLDKNKAKEAFQLITDESLNITTRVTLLVALLTLDKNEHEQVLIVQLKKHFQNSENIFNRLLFQQPAGRYEKIVNQLIQKKDLDKEQAQEAVDLFFNPSEPEYIKAAFLEAERLKRETTLENTTFLHSFWNRVKREKYQGNTLIDFCNNYDGWVRTANYSLFTALFISYLGYPTVMHGLDSVAPKNGYTNQQIINQSSLLQGMIRSKKQEFYYYDQAFFFPALYAMKKLRHDMVKRPFLATIERLLQPLQAEEGNCQVIGYTHPAYKLEFARITQQKQVKKAIIIKGEEGSTQLSLTRPTEYLFVNQDKITEGLISPAELGISLPEPMKGKPDPAYILASLNPHHSGYKWAKATILYNTISVCKLLEIRDFNLSELQDEFENFCTRII